jgi:hypothetical protein
MEFRITKNKDKPHVILYKRDDGTETWMYSEDFFVVHDLSHFAIEKTLHYTTAFMGMLNNGMDVRDFENGEKRKNIPVTNEATWAENMANLFLMEITQGKLEDFNKTVRESFVRINKSVEPPFLNEIEITSIRNYLSELINNWRALPVGQSMKLVFDLKNNS